MANSKRKIKLNKDPKRSKLIREILAICIGAFGLFIAVSIYANAGGIIGNALKYLLFGLFGYTAYILPPLMSAIAIYYAFFEKMSKYKLTIMVLSSVELAALWHFMYRTNNTVIPNGIFGLFNEGVKQNGGGVFGGVLTEPLINLLDFWGTFLLLFAILAVMITIIFEISVISLFKGFIMFIKRIFSDIYTAVREGGEKETQVAEKQLKKREPIAAMVGGVNKEPEIRPYNWQEDEDMEIVINDPLGQQDKDEPKALEKDVAKEEQKPILPDKPIDPSQVEQIHIELPKKTYKYPTPDLLDKIVQPSGAGRVEELKANAQRLIDILASFGIDAKITNITRGSSVTRYEILPAPGVKVNKITALDQDIALRLPATYVRIEVLAGSIGIEVTNDSISSVYMRSLIESEEFKNHPSKIAVALGKDIDGKTVVLDIEATPHMLIAGATGSGKSVCINTIISSILYKSSPEEVRLVMVDPKVVELGVYNGIPHLLVPVVTDPRKAAGALCWAVQEMENRYKLFSEHRVRNIKGYNKAITEMGFEAMPQIVIIIDELADLMMVAPGEVQDYICRIAQKARAAGMHLVVATQRPSVDVITGLIKANIPTRLSFAVSSQIDSRTILDGGGAEKLMGRGDMLLMLQSSQKLLRVQGAFVSDKDVERLTGFVKENAECEYNETVLQTIESGAAAPDSGQNKDDGDSDQLFAEAAEVAFELGQISASMLQRRLKVGYARAGRLIDELERRKVISGYDGSNKPRQVTMSRQEYLEMINNK